MPVDVVDLGVVLLGDHVRAARPEALDAVGQRAADRLEQALALLGREPVGRRERRELRGVQDLVGVGAADADERVLVAQQRVQLSPARERGLERGVVERRVERLGAVAREVLLEARPTDSRRTRTDLRVTRSLTTSSPSSSKRTASTGAGRPLRPGSA